MKGEMRVGDANVEDLTAVFAGWCYVAVFDWVKLPHTTWKERTLFLEVSIKEDLNDLRVGIGRE